MAPPEAPPVAWLARWIETKRRKNCVPKTVERYRRTVGAVLKWMEGESRPTDPRAWTVEDVQALRKARNCDHWTLSVLNDFAKFYGATSVVESGIPSKPAPTHVRWLSKAQVSAALAAVRGDPVLELVAVLGLGQGLRRIEWQRIRIADVDLTHGRMLVRGKGRGSPKLVEVPLHPAFPKAYGAYLRLRNRWVRAAGHRSPRPSLPDDLLVHPARGGLKGYSLSGLDLLVHRIQERTRAMGVSVRLSSHMFRRSGATLLEEALLASPRASKDGVYRVVQGFLRHDNLATTMRYLEANPARQERALREYAAVLPWDGPGGGAKISRPKTSISTRKRSNRPASARAGRT